MQIILWILYHFLNPAVTCNPDLLVFALIFCPLSNLFIKFFYLNTVKTAKYFLRFLYKGFSNHSSVLPNTPS